MEHKVEDFLLRHRLSAAAFHWESELVPFLAEMGMARNGIPASLKMIPTFLELGELPKEPVTVAAIDIGGTNVRSAAITLNRDGILDIQRLPAFKTPGIGRRVTARDFFREIAANVREHLAIDHIGICFSLAADPLPDGDAIVTAGAKQLDVPDLVGCRVAASFRAAAEELGVPCGQHITVINDTLAAALGGMLDAGSGNYSGFIGFIYGTGTNIAFREPDGAFINVESGAYCGFTTGDIDDLYDRSCIDPGCDRFEKMVSGGYQGGLLRLALEAAEREGLLSHGFSERLAGKALASPDISAFLAKPTGDGSIASACASKADRAVVASICNGMTERSALLCGVTITATLLRAGIGVSASAPAFITAEGSTYLKQVGFREHLDACMAKYAGKHYGFHYEFHYVPDAVIKGAAIAAMR